MNHASPRRRRRRSWPIVTPAGWRGVRRANSMVYDALVPAALVLIALAAVALVGFAVGILAGIIPYDL